jgi:molecular chaperone HscB
MSSVPDFFALLELTPDFDMDAQALETAYFKQQRLYHPDRYVGRPAADRQQALMRSVDINDAYHTLKNPLSRAQYILHLQGIAVGTERDSIKPSPALLMETMEWRENIDAGNTQELEKMDRELSDKVAQSLTGLTSFYRGQAWEAMAHETLRLGYLHKAREAVTQRLKRLEKQAS